ncbi:MAG: hypothetical protein IPG71_10455 [bacterium]|nr:hypothetical protein [bacterium]
MNKRLLMTLIISVMAVNAHATIRTVNQFGTAQFTTVQAAVSAAATGDTILIAPGTYVETPSFSTKVLTIIGAGWDLTTIDGGGSTAWTLSGVGVIGSVLEGMDCPSSNLSFNLSTNGDSVTVRRCRLRSTGNIVISGTNGKRLYLEDCLLTSAVNGSMINVSVTAGGGFVAKGCIFGFTGGADERHVFQRRKFWSH